MYRLASTSMEVEVPRKKQAGAPLFCDVSNMTREQRELFHVRLQALIEEIMQEGVESPPAPAVAEPTYVRLATLLAYVQGKVRQVDRPKRTASVIWYMLTDPGFWYPEEYRHELMFVFCDICGEHYGGCRCKGLGTMSGRTWHYVTSQQAASRWLIDVEALTQQRDGLATRRYPHYGPKTRRLVLDWVDSL